MLLCNNNAAGILVSYIFTLNGYWWLFLAIITLWFPVYARSVKFRGHYRYLHLAVIMMSLTLALIPVVSAFATGGYTIFTFSSLLSVCYPKDSAVFFYTFVVPFCVVLPAGSTFNLLTLWKVIRIRKNIPSQVKRLMLHCVYL